MIGTSGEIRRLGSKLQSSMIIELPEFAVPKNSHKRKTTALERHHVVVAKLILREGESQDEFLRHLGTHIARYRPESQSEMRIVEGIAGAEWRRNRTRAAMDALFLQLIPANPCPRMVRELDVLRRRDDRLAVRFMRLCRRARVMVTRVARAALMEQRLQQASMERQARRSLYFERLNARKSSPSAPTPTHPIQ